MPPKKSRRLFCSRCKRGFGYPSQSQIKWYGSEKKLQKKYLCRKCRKRKGKNGYTEYLKKVRGE